MNTMVRKMKFEEDYDYIIEKLNGIEQDIEFLKKTLQHKADKQKAVNEIEDAEDDIYDLYDRIAHEKTHKRMKYPDACCWFR